jgi:predicted metalloprotease with PDZ domain
VTKSRRNLQTRIKTTPALLLILFFFPAICSARNRVTISIPTFGELKIEAEVSPSRSWSFRNAYANALGIAERVNGFQAFGTSGQEVGVKRIVVGEFRSDLDATKISYSVRLSTPASGGLIHVSWLTDDRGYLMFADLVPLDVESLSARFKLPPGWTVESSLAPDTNGEFQVSEPVTAVFFVGRSLRKASATLDGAIFDVVLSGKWSSRDSDALKAATRVMQKYLAMTQFKLRGKSIIMISAPPIQAKMNEWWAETRGSTVALLIEPRGDHWKEHLTVIFTHELFHLWVPNSLKLEGDYDWFFEGFTLYIALRMALELDVIKFKEFLNTLGRAYDSYLSQPDDSSLLEASEKRWTTSGSQVYVKGMLVAFLYDLLVRKESAGRATLEDRYRDLFSGRGAEHSQGNEAIIKVLGTSPVMIDFTKTYIENVRKLELNRVLPAYGLVMDSTGKASRLRVNRELNDEQKRLLRSLGYRN